MQIRRADKPNRWNIDEEDREGRHGWSMNGMNVKEYTSTTSVSANIADVIALNI